MVAGFLRNGTHNGHACFSFFHGVFYPGLVLLMHFAPGDMELGLHGKKIRFPISRLVSRLLSRGAFISRFSLFGWRMWRGGGGARRVAGCWFFLFALVDLALEYIRAGRAEFKV